jgi:hypothetical protein
MRKVRKLVLVCIICSFILSNFLNSVYAIDDIDASEVSMDKSEFDSISQTGTASVETENGSIVKKIGKTESSIGSGTGKISSSLVPWVAGLDYWIVNFAIDGGLKYAYIDNGEIKTDSENGIDKNGLLTMYSIAFGEFLLFDANVLKTNQSLNPTVTPTKTAELLDDLKSNVASTFNITEYFGILLSLPIFIYALFRALGAQSARDLAAWKKVLGRWLVVLILLFIVQYILAAIAEFNNVIMNMLWNVRLELESQGHTGIEIELFEKTADQILNTGGNLSLAYSIEFIFMAGLQILFFIKYIMRMFSLMLLTVLGPIIIIMHGFKIMLGKDSSTLKSWIKKYISLIYMQPIHAILYLVFMFTASEIVVQIPVLAIIMMYALYRGENIAKGLLNMEEGISIL